MLQETSTVDIGEQPAYYSTPNSSQTEQGSPTLLPIIEGFSILKGWDVVSVGLDLYSQVSDIVYETVPIDFQLSEAESIHPSVYYRNPEAVRAYLASYPEIESFLEVTLPVLFRCFGGPVNIVLEVMNYPEKGAYDELVGWIQSTDGVSEGLGKLERFEDEWLFEQLGRVGNKFNFNIEFK
jgi:hypothetical protein